MTDDMQVIAPQTESVEILGRKIEIGPLRVGQIPKVIRCLEGAEIESDEDGNLDVIRLVADHSDRVIEAMAMITGIPSEELAEADFAEFSHLVSEWVALNTDFFVHRVVPIYRPLVRRMVTAIAEVRAQTAGSGLTASSS